MLTRRVSVAVFFLFMLAVGSVHSAGDPVRGAQLGEWCVECHGDDLMGDDDVPAIRGMDEAAMFKELMAFKTGERVDELGDMVDNVEEFNEQDLADLAAYFSSLSKPEK